ncbi:hypothetical protein FSJ98_024875, partial [Escherichia coli]|nr:hypothetical protein [Escherichia coli]
HRALSEHKTLSISWSHYQARYYLMTLDREKKIRRTPLRQGARTLWGVLREK